ncbi:DNA-binding GntR family transcriptional regulator [Roseibium hamelinense]|uniref:DNA-binding GntR family transcriptional regulator n=1 Tax=Roseibium hamelinense TaxID=150831 RepID=A0A562SVK5_9HYPH|nr:GntR family transcriptional regulator [Roseibium hamelinense]MTI43211.1 GntR family transcriptional regulator [Roseibium hamelinense]TWI84740.1 DNA-binding GntR family transcriptional regulator [Roseibium hamelinense]
MTKEDIYEQLRMRICLLDLAPGAKLNERDLAAEFGISRTPMRAVLQRLEYDGLIDSQHGRGTTVTSIDLNGMRDIYRVRMHLMDALAESEPAPVTDQMLDELDQLLIECADLTEARDKRRFAQINIRLHRIIHGLAPNDVLRGFNEVLFFQSARFWFLLLDDLDFAEQAGALADEVRMVRRALALKDVKLVASIHKAQLAMVLSSITRHDRLFEEQLERLV